MKTQYLRAVLLKGILLLFAISFSGTAYGIGPYTLKYGNVVDNATGLEWQQSDDGHKRNWEEALAYCENLSLADYNDWRLPNIRELMSITNRSLYNPSIDPVFSSNSSSYWSSTTRIGYPWSSQTNAAWTVIFNTGENNRYYKSIRSSYVRCVRGGLPLPLSEKVTPVPALYLLILNSQSETITSKTVNQSHP